MAKPQQQGHSDDQWMLRLGHLVDELEEEIWFYANRKGKDRVAAFQLYLDMIIVGMRSLSASTDKRKDETFKDKSYQGEKET